MRWTYRVAQKKRVHFFNQAVLGEYLTNRSKINAAYSAMMSRLQEINLMSFRSLETYLWNLGIFCKLGAQAFLTVWNVLTFEQLGSEDRHIVADMSHHFCHFFRRCFGVTQTKIQCSTSRKNPPPILCPLPTRSLKNIPSPRQLVEIMFVIPTLPKRIYINWGFFEHFYKKCHKYLFIIPLQHHLILCSWWRFV